MKSLITIVLTRILIILIVSGVIFGLRNEISTQVQAEENIELVEYKLPSDIMVVEFSDEIWKYRLFENGIVKKIVVKKENQNGCS